MRATLKLGVVLALLFCPIQHLLASNKLSIPAKPDVSALQNKLGDNANISVSPLNGHPDFITSKKPGAPLWKGSQKNSRDTARKFLREFAPDWGIKNPDADLKLLQEIKDGTGHSHLSYNQTFQGVPVFGGQIIVHLKDKQTVMAVNGETNIPDQLDTQPKLNQDGAVAQAKKIWAKKEKGDPQLVGTPRLYVYNQKFLAARQKDDQNYLVWQVDLLAPKPYQHKKYFVNAANGSLVDQRDAVKKAISRRVFNCNAWQDYSACVLEDTLHGMDNGRIEGGTARGITDIDNLYDYTGSIFNYYSTKYGRNGANNHGGLGDSIINPYSKTDSYGLMDNDPYRGEYCPDNAFFEDAVESGGASINFCSGSATEDVVGHEYTHGVSYYSILDGYGDPYGLDYWYESGAIEEGDADIFGEAIENYISGSSDWLMAEGLASGPFRSMSDPANLNNDGLGPYPPQYNSANFYCDFWDNGGVHHNSTVISHAAYLMAMGGSYNGCSISGIGRTKEEAIFYQAITHYFTVTTDFNEAYTALNAACADLYGVSSTDCANVKKALRSVEIDQPGACSGIPATTPQCSFDSAPTVTSVDASADSGSYGPGSDMDIYVYFSEPVTSTGSVTVNLNSGASCTFDVSNYSFGWCDYLVRPNDNADRLAVTSISGAIQDGDGNAMTNSAPANNFGSKAIRIDTTDPVISGVEDGKTYNTDLAPTFNEGTATLNDEPFTSGQTISQEGDYLLVVTDDVGNSTSVSFILEKVSASVTSIPYSTRKNNRRIVFTVYGLNLPGRLKANKFSLRLNGRKIKIVSVRNSGGNVLLNTRQNYRKWPAGDYNFALSYNFKIKKIRYRGAASSNYVLTIE
jgi:bacillolysin